MKNVLVTGSNGFLGRSLIHSLRTNGYNVLEFDVDQGDLAGLDPLSSFVNRNIRHTFHLAGKTFVPDSWKTPSAFYRINIQGTVNVLEFCRQSGSSLTYVSSYLYGEPEYLPIDEKHPVKAYNPYSLSKKLAEEIVLSFTQQFKVRTTIFRPFNVYGPGQPNHFIIPAIIQQVLSPDVDVVEVMDLRPKRDYIYLDDVISAFLLSLEGTPDIYNLGSGYSVSVRKIIEEVMEISGVTKPFQDKNREREQEIFDLYADISRISDQLHWLPQTTFREGLTKCLKSYSFSHSSF